MPTLTLEAKDPCPQCGYESIWIRVASFRVNKKSLRQRDSGAILAHATPGGCPECGFHFRRDSSPKRWQLKPNDQETVDSYRRKRGWI